MELPTDYTALSPHERRAVREQYVRKQKNLCYYCNAPLDEPPPKEITSKPIYWRAFPPNFLKHPVHLQHCHKTNMTEGAVHAYCNAVLWQYHGR